MKKRTRRMDWLVAGLVAVALTVGLVTPVLADAENVGTGDEFEDEWAVNGWEDEGWYEDDEAELVNPFPDVPDSADYAEAVTALAAMGIFTGDERGNFNPDANITRAEMATIMCRSLNVAPALDCSRFADTAGHWAAGYVETAAACGVINGDGTGNFRPDNHVTYEQAVKMLVCSCGGGEDYALNHGGWPDGYLQAGLAFGLMNNLPGNTDAPTQRSVVAQLVYNAMML